MLRKKILNNSEKDIDKNKNLSFNTAKDAEGAVDGNKKASRMGEPIAPVSGAPGNPPATGRANAKSGMMESNSSKNSGTDIDIKVPIYNAKPKDSDRQV